MAVLWPIGAFKKKCCDYVLIGTVYFIAVPTCSTHDCNNDHGECRIGPTSGTPFCICIQGFSGDNCENGKIKNSKAHCKIVSAGQLSSIIDAILMLNYMRIMLKCSVDVI